MNEPDADRWTVPLCDGADACASIHGDDVSALCTAQACHAALVEGRPYKTVAGELPSTWPADRIARRVAAFLPRTGMLVASLGGVVRLPARVRDPETGRTVSSAPEAAFVPVTPSDSICVAMALPRLLARRWPAWRPAIRLVDLPVRPGPRRLSEPGSALAGQDPYAMVVEGVPAWYAARAPAFRRARIEPLDTLREAHMATGIRRILREGGGPLLLVTGAAHVENIRRFLRNPACAPRPPAVRRGGDSFSLLSVSSAVLHANGLLGKFPALSLDFWNSLEFGTLFDQPRAAVSFLGRCVERARNSLLCPPATEDAVRLQRFARRRHQSSGTFVCLKILLEAAEAVAGRPFARLAHDMAFEFPPDGLESRDHAGDHPAARFVPAGDGTTFVLFTRDGAFAGHMASDGGFVIPPAVGAPRTQLTHGQRKSLSGYGCRREHVGETKLCRACSEVARATARSVAQRRASRPFVHSLHRGVDVRRTVRARAAHRNELYVFQSRPDHAHRAELAGEPVVYLFDAIPRPIVRREGTIIPRHPSDANDNFGYSAFYWFARRESLGETGVVRSEISVLLDLRRGHLPAARRTLADIERAVAPFKDRLCQIPPWTDPDLRDLDPADQAIACAVRHARQAVVVVAPGGWCPGDRVTALARNGDVHLHVVPHDAIPRDDLERLRLDHVLPSLNHFDLPPDWLLALVPPVRC